MSQSSGGNAKAVVAKSGVKPATASTMVIFGASGDLTRRKLIPALFALHRKGRLPAGMRVVGVSRTPMADDAWREQLRSSLLEELEGDGPEAHADTRAAASSLSTAAWDDSWREFASRVHYLPGDVQSADSFAELAKLLDQLEGGGDSARVYYLATMPQLYAPTIAQLGAAGLADERGGPRRIVVEKPFGVDLRSARELNAAAHAVFAERQVYRIDHYLGKETVQNLLVLRFANSILEPVWNRNYIDHVQITVAEDLQVGGRGAYYDPAGVLRDMFQNHLLQLMMVTAMEAPVRFRADDIRNEKVKVLRAVRPLSGADFARDTVRGQYAGYLDEQGVAHESQTATFAALKLHIDSWRWNGVPFYLRSGKAMSCRTTQIVIQFRDPPHLLFNDTPGEHPQANRLVIQIQPNEGIQLQLQTKVPDAGMRLRMTDLDFRFRREYTSDLPDAYQRLLMDALQGDASLFARSDEVELAWGIVDPILAAWQSPAAPPLETYELGAWGPASCAQWMQSQGRQWFDVCPVLH